MLLKYLFSLLITGWMVSVSDAVYRSSSSYRSSSYRSAYTSYQSAYTPYRSSYGYYSYNSYNSYNSYRSYRAAAAYYSYYSALYLYYPYSGAYGSFYRTNGRYNDGANGNICKNYNSNANGTALGEFRCPMPWEPTSHTACCGNAGEEYCCQFKDSSLLYLAIFGTIAGVVILVIIISCSIKVYKKKEGTINPNQGSTAANQSSRGAPPPYPSPNRGQNWSNQTPYGQTNPNQYGPQVRKPTQHGGNSSWQQQPGNSYGGWNQPPPYNGGSGAPPPVPYNYSQSGPTVYNQPPANGVYQSPPDTDQIKQ